VTALVSDCDHFWDYPKSFVLKPLQATTQTKSAEEIGQTVVKEFVQDKLIKKYLKFHGRLSNKRSYFETLDSHKGRQRSLDHKANCCGSCRNYLHNPFRWTSLSYLTFNCNAQWQSEEAISKVRSEQDIAREWLWEPVHYLQGSLLPPILAFLYLQEWGMYYYRRDSVELFTLAYASTAKTFGELCGKFNTHATSYISDKHTRVKVVFGHYLPNFTKGGKEA